MKRDTMLISILVIQMGVPVEWAYLHDQKYTLKGKVRILER